MGLKRHDTEGLPDLVGSRETVVGVKSEALVRDTGSMST